MTVVNIIMNEISEHIVDLGIGAVAGKLLAYTVNHIVPNSIYKHLCDHLPVEGYAAIVCGAIATTVHSLCFRSDSTWASRVVGAVLLFYAPQKACEYLNLPITFKASIGISITVFSLFVLFKRIMGDDASKRNREFVSMK